MATIELENIGPITHATIPIPEGGGVCVLRGRNGIGKSTALEAIDSAVTGKGKLSVRDGSVRGSVNAFGVTISVSRSTRRTGELEVVSLTGKLTIADLVDPGYSGAEAADAARIKALVALTGETPSASQFWDLVGGQAEFEAVVSESSMSGTDAVEMAARIKRDLEKAARLKESEAENIENRARAICDLNLDVGEVPDVDSLMRASADADMDLRRLVEASTRCRQAEATRKVARESLSNFESLLAKHGVDAAKSELDAKQASMESIKQNIAATEKKIDLARLELQSLLAKMQDTVEEIEKLQSSIKSAASMEQSVAELREVLAADAEIHPSEEAMQAAANAVRAATSAYEAGIIAREAARKRAEANKLIESCRELRLAAGRLRTAGQRTDEVLTALVAQSCDRLTVHQGRLRCHTRRGATLFSELSHGERWKIAIDIAIDAVGPNGLITIPQEAWEGLDPMARIDIAKHFRARKAGCVTAVNSDDDEMIAEVFNVDE